MTYRITMTPSARKALAALPKTTMKRMDKAILALAENPNPLGSKSLQGKHKGLSRIRVGTYRVIYSVQRTVVTVTIIRIAHRKDVYRGL